MRSYYEKPKFYTEMYGEIYYCNSVIYNRCTLFKIGSRGLSIIQQRYDSKTKVTWWGEIDPWLTDELYLHSGFKKYFDEHAGKCEKGIYPTVTIRQIMWALKMKPMKKEPWETALDRKKV